MAKILLTSNQKWDSYLRNMYAQNGFSENGRNEEGLYLTTYSKINFHTENLIVDGSDYIACAGTLIYEGLTGSEALARLLHDIKCNGVSETRKKIIGSYMVVYKLDDTIRCFVDETGIYALYYFDDSRGIVITNTYYHIAKVTCNDVNVLGLLETTLENCIVDRDTPFYGICRLLPDEELSISLNDMKISVEKLEVYKYSLTSTEKIGIAEELNKTAQILLDKCKSVIEDPHVFLTGGVDSRLILANYLACDIKPTVCSWHNSPCIMNTKEQDTEIVCAIAETMDLVCKCFDMKENPERLCNSITEKDFDARGEYAVIYNGNENWHSILNHSEIKFVDYGYFGETLKEWTLLEGVGDKKVTLEWYIDKYMSRYGFRNHSVQVVQYEQLKKQLTSEFEKICEKEELNPEKLGREECMILYYWYRLHADTVVYQYANNYCYAFPIYAQKSIADLINAVPYKYKEAEQLNLAMVKMLAPHLLEVPFYSHCSRMVFDSKKMKLSLEQTMFNRLKSKIANILSKTDIGMSLVLKYQRHTCNIIENKNEEIARNEIYEMLKTNKCFEQMGIEFDEKSSKYIPGLVGIFSYCLLIESARNTKTVSDKVD